MSAPPKTTVAFDNLPGGWLIGIDLYFFSSNDIFRGIKLIPDGFHIVHWAKSESDIRFGHPFFAKNNEIITLLWDEKNEQMLREDEMGELNVSRIRSKLPDDYQFMIKYPNDEENDFTGQETNLHSWYPLTSTVTESVMNSIFPLNALMCSASTSKAENSILLESLKKSAKQRHPDNIEEDNIIKSLVDQSKDEIRFTEINLKRSFKLGTTGSELTKSMLDKSWYLEEILHTLNNNHKLLLGELQLCFIMIIVFANYSASIQWKTIVSLLCGCEEALTTKPKLYIEFLSIIKTQLENCPQEYMSDLLSSEYIFKTFRHFYKQIYDLSSIPQGIQKALSDLSMSLKVKYQIHIDVSYKEIDDNSSNNDEESETGEYAPIVVET